MLILSSNRISFLPAGIFDKLAYLSQLELANNRISSIPQKVFDRLENLRVLTLNDNQISLLLEGVFDSLTLIDHLPLFNNRISSLPAGIFDKLTSLIALELNNNMITSLPDNVFDKLSQLFILRLNDNAIASLPLGIFNQLTSLERLYLQNNKIAVLPEGIFDALPLHDLSLENNQISSLPRGIFDSMEPYNSSKNHFYHYRFPPSNPSLWFGDGDMRLHLGFNSLQEIPFGTFQQSFQIQSLAEGNTLSCMPALPPELNLRLDRQSSALAPCECPAGEFLTSWSQGCTKCAASCSAGQELCPRGSTVRNECRNCPPGTYGTPDYQCMPCGVGTYQSAEGQTACVLCPTNMTTTSRGSTSDSSCVCDAGYKVTADSDGMSSLLAGVGTNVLDGAGSEAAFDVPQCVSNPSLSLA